jgi:hypothetical protein
LLKRLGNPVTAAEWAHTQGLRLNELPPGVHRGQCPHLNVVAPQSRGRCPASSRLLAYPPLILTVGRLEGYESDRMGGGMVWFKTATRYGIHVNVVVVTRVASRHGSAVAGSIDCLTNHTTSWFMAILIFSVQVANDLKGIRIRRIALVVYTI